MSEVRAPAIRQRKTRDDLAHLSGVERGAYRVFEFLSSIRLAVIVLPWLIIECIVGALIEAKVNTGGARYFVYDSWHFLACLGMLALNIFCAAVIRFPWKRYQVGFVVTHIGLLVLLFGSFLTLRHKLDSLMVATKFEGQSDESRWARTIVDPTKELIEVAELDEKTGQGKEHLPHARRPGAVHLGRQALRLHSLAEGSRRDATSFPTATKCGSSSSTPTARRKRRTFRPNRACSALPAIKAELAFDGRALFSRWIPLGTQVKSVDLQFGVSDGVEGEQRRILAPFRSFATEGVARREDAGGGLLGWLTVSTGEQATSLPRRRSSPRQSGSHSRNERLDRGRRLLRRRSARRQGRFADGRRRRTEQPRSASADRSRRQTDRRVRAGRRVQEPRHRRQTAGAVPLQYRTAEDAEAPAVAGGLRRRPSCDVHTRRISSRARSRSPALT